MAKNPPKVGPRLPLYHQLPDPLTPSVQIPLSHWAWALWLGTEVARVACRNSGEHLTLAFHGALMLGMRKRIYLGDRISSRYYGTPSEALYFHALREIERRGGIPALAMCPDLRSLSSQLKTHEYELYWTSVVAGYLLKLQVHRPDEVRIGLAKHLAKEIPQPGVGKPGSKNIGVYWPQFKNASHLIYAYSTSYVSPSDLLLTSIDSTIAPDYDIPKMIATVRQVRSIFAAFSDSTSPNVQRLVNIEHLVDPERSSLWRLPFLRDPVNNATAGLEIAPSFFPEEEKEISTYNPPSGLIASRTRKHATEGESGSDSGAAHVGSRYP